MKQQAAELERVNAVLQQVRFAPHSCSANYSAGPEAFSLRRSSGAECSYRGARAPIWQRAWAAQ
jgi:hypothetical protein